MITSYYILRLAFVLPSNQEKLHSCAALMKRYYLSWPTCLGNCVSLVIATSNCWSFLVTRTSKMICAIGVMQPRPSSIATRPLIITTWNRLSWLAAIRLGNETKLATNWMSQLLDKSLISWFSYMSGSSDYERASSSSYFRPSSLRSRESSMYESPSYDSRHSMYLSSRSSRDSDTYRGTIG